MPQLAYLVIREGAKWSDVFRLVPGQSVTIGRAPTNQIVIKDERCSRAHAEVFVSDDQWVVRDLASRNGTRVGDEALKGDWILHPGDIIRIGRSQLVFVYRLNEAFNESSTVTRQPEGSSASVFDDDSSHIMVDGEPTTITHRKGQTRFLEPGQPDEGGISKVGRAAAKLCKLAFELAKTPDVVSLAEQALNGQFEATQTDAGAVFLLPRDLPGPPRGEDLELVASRTLADLRYHRVSNFLAKTVMNEGEAVLARNVMGDSALGGRDSKGKIHATSLICAPIRQGATVLGLIHLYSTNPERVLDPDDLEFTLAVADTMAVALTNLNRRQELADDLTVARTENVELRERLGVQSEIVGRSPLMAEVNEQISRAAATKATVLIRGESGVGKELVARAIHFSSARRKSTFICLNCAALAEDLLASELFGHERGAFTGATDRKIGKFEASDK